MDEKIYQEELMDHYKNPSNRKKIEDPDFAAGEHNPSCGDKIYIEGKMSNAGTLVDVGFSGVGCVISQATTSMLTELCKGMTAEQILALTKENILNMIGLKLGPNRLKCALLSLQVLQQGMIDFLKKNT